MQHLTALAVAALLAASVLGSCTEEPAHSGGTLFPEATDTPEETLTPTPTPSPGPDASGTAAPSPTLSALGVLNKVTATMRELDTFFVVSKYVVTQSPDDEDKLIAGTTEGAGVVGGDWWMAIAFGVKEGVDATLQARLVDEQLYATDPATGMWTTDDTTRDYRFFSSSGFFAGPNDPLALDEPELETTTLGR